MVPVATIKYQSQSSCCDSCFLLSIMDVSLRLMNSNSQDSQAKPDAGFNVTTSLTSHYISAPRRWSGPRCEELKTSLEERPAAHP